jgi:hypothetical protein
MGLLEYLVLSEFHAALETEQDTAICQVRTSVAVTGTRTNKKYSKSQLLHIP